jgi:sulfotransferase
MSKRFHFIAGLPRAGSTLLSAILRQNPAFYARVTSPLYAMTDRMIDAMGPDMKYSSFFDEERRIAVLRGLFDSYYHDFEPAGGGVVFDTNRMWTSSAPLVAKLFPQSKIVCCVRGVDRIIDSFERVLRNNPLEYNSLFAFKNEPTIYGRVKMMMNARDGVIGGPHSALRSVWFTEHAKRLVVVRYESLVKQPEQTMASLYQTLGLAGFRHDFNDVEYAEPEYDSRIGLPGLHTTRGRVEFRESPFSIPPDVVQNYRNSNFWDAPGENVHGVKVI